MSHHAVELVEGVEVRAETHKAYDGFTTQLSGIFVGRFQPFHLGHLHAILNITEKEKDVHKLYIIIGSSRKSHTPKNPFTAGERMTMIHNTLEECAIERGNPDVFIVPIADAHEGTVWRQRVINHIPDFQVVFSSLGETSRLFREYGYEIREVKYHKRESLSGTNVRKLMIAPLYDGVVHPMWSKFVPDRVAEYIHSIDGVGRARELNGVATAL